MSSNEIDNLNETVAQALQQMKAERGDTFSLKKVNLAELFRRTGISRKRLRMQRSTDSGSSPIGTQAGKKAIRSSPATR